MITPKEKIIKFHNKDFYLHSELAVDLAKTENVELVDKLKLTLAFIATIIEVYEEMLVDIRNLEKPICRCMCEKNKIAVSYNNSLYEAREIIESKIQQWKELLNNK